MIITVKNTAPLTFVVSDLNGKEIVGTFCEKELQPTSQKEFTVENGIKRKCNKLYAKWSGYDNFLNIWIDKKEREYFAEPKC